MDRNNQVALAWYAHDEEIVPANRVIPTNASEETVVIFSGPSLITPKFLI